MKHIVIDAREFTTTTGRYTYKLVEYLQQVDNAHKYTILLKQKDYDVWEPTNPNFSKVVCPHKEFTFAEQIGLLRQVNGLKPDLVHFAMVQQPVLYRGKTVTTMQDLTTIRFRNPAKNPVVFWLKRQVYKWVNKRVAHKSNAIITPTQFVKEDVTNYAHVSPAKITVTLESADPIRDAPEPMPLLKDKQFIMYTGRPTPHKNLGRLIDAFVLLQETHPDLELVLVGKKDTNYEKHEAAAVARNIKNITFTGFVSDGQLRWLYEHCAAYVFPSLSEGFGLPGLEAMSHGAPVASSNATCLPEVHGKAAHYFDPISVEDMARAINDILANPALRRKLVVSGKKQVARYSWMRMAKQTLAVYESTLGN